MEMRGRGEEEKRVVVTWNMKRLSVRETNRRRLRRVAERVTRQSWR